jgi:hypothetical protein
MQRWPSLRRVLGIWAALAVVSYLAYVSFLHSQPPDELAMASDLSYQATIGLVVVGLPALAFLFLFLFVGAVAKRWLHQPEPRLKDRSSSAQDTHSTSSQ